MYKRCLPILQRHYYNDSKHGDDVTYLVDCGRDPKHLPVGIDEHVRFVADLVIAVGAE